MSVIIAGLGIVTNLHVFPMGDVYKVECDAGTVTAQKFSVEVIRGERPVAKFTSSKTASSMFISGEHVEFILKGSK